MLLDIANLVATDAPPWCAGFQQQLGHPIICGTIATISQGGAFQPHYDLNDLLLPADQREKAMARVCGNEKSFRTSVTPQAPPPETEPAMSSPWNPAICSTCREVSGTTPRTTKIRCMYGLHLDSPTWGVKFGGSPLRMLEDDPVFAEGHPGVPRSRRDGVV